MCKECGCGLPGETPVRVDAGHEHAHEHEHTHEHAHGDHVHLHPHNHAHEHGHQHASAHTHFQDHPDEREQEPAAQSHRSLEVRRAILEKNDRQAERNRGFFRGRGILVLNVLSSPGSGKTTLLAETARALMSKLKLAVIVGDLATDNDARRLRASGMPVVQITTGTVCHLEAEMVGRALGQIDLSGLELLIVENVGNLVCPASYDLGEDLRVVLLSVTEGEDKPLKYPPMFQLADLVLISKTDLSEACGWNREVALKNIGRVAPRAKVIELSAKSGKGLDSWLQFLVSCKDGQRGTQLSPVAEKERLRSV